MENNLNQTDLQDVSNFSSGNQSQFNPEFSHEAYLSLKSSEDKFEFANYFKFDRILNFDCPDSNDRDKSVFRIIELCKLKNYRQETLHLAISIFDRILHSHFHLISKEKLILLVVSSVILGAKME